MTFDLFSEGHDDPLYTAVKVTPSKNAFHTRLDSVPDQCTRSVFGAFSPESVVSAPHFQIIYEGGFMYGTDVLVRSDRIMEIDYYFPCRYILKYPCVFYQQDHLTLGTCQAQHGVRWRIRGAQDARPAPWGWPSRGGAVLYWLSPQLGEDPPSWGPGVMWFIGSI